MSDTDLKNYQSQLQQVEASLIVSPDNEDLLKLKKDLQEVIDLTKELLGLPVTSKEGTTATTDDVPFINWSVGDRCSAIWSKDQQYYPATIVEVLDDGLVSVKFDKYSATNQVTQVSVLKQLQEGNQRKRMNEARQDPHANVIKKTKKDLQAAQREQKRKKNEKKRLRVKELEEQKEKEKNKWLSFNAKAFSKKSSKGKVKKSIFASPDTVDGKVGVGTCGHSGQPMTAYHQNEKWKKAANL